MTLRSTLGRSLARALSWLLRNKQPRVIYDGDGVNPYLSRYYLLGAPKMPDGSTPFDQYGNPKPEAKFPENAVSLYVHRFHRSDVDRELHNHPWRWALSFVIAGGYREERRKTMKVAVSFDGKSSPAREVDYVAYREVRPLSFNRIRANDFHRVDLLEQDAWTLFLVGPKVASWGFWCRRYGAFTPWREFLARKQRGRAQA